MYFLFHMHLSDLTRQGFLGSNFLQWGHVFFFGSSSLSFFCFPQPPCNLEHWDFLCSHACGLRSSSDKSLLELTPYADLVYTESVSSPIITWRKETDLATKCTISVPGAGASLTSRMPLAPTSSLRMNWSKVASCAWLYVYFLCMAYGQAKLTAIVGFGGCLDVGQQHERELWDTNTIPYVAIRATFDCISSMLMLTFLQKSKLWLIISSSCSNTSFLDGQSAPSMANFITSNRVKLAMFFVVTDVGCPEDGIGDVAANELGDDFNHNFFGADDQLIDDIQLVGFLLCLRL
jgi:hypothetical protein